MSETTPQPQDLLSAEVELTEAQFDALLSQRPWSPYPPELQQLLDQLPNTGDQDFTRTDVLVWTHRRQGLIGFDQVWKSLEDVPDDRSARRAAVAVLNVMLNQQLLSRMHFTADAPGKDPLGLNSGTAFEITARGMIYLRGALMARHRLAKSCGALQAHRILNEEEDNFAYELHYLKAVVVRDAAGKVARPQRLVNSVFALAH